MSYVRVFTSFVLELISRRQVIVDLTKRDFITKYLGSYLGILWAFLHPAIYILLMWFVFGIVFKSQPVNDVPFVLWVMAGMVPWFFFNDAISSATWSILENNFLVKKMAFSIGILPLVKLISTMIIHLFQMALVLLIFILNGLPIPIHSIQIIYYLASALVLLLGLSWLTSSLIIFLRDVGQVVAMVLQFLFWGTPIFWSVKQLPLRLQPYFKLNPIVYIVEGYRDSLVNRIWFWEHWLQTLYFWVITSVLLVVGAVVFRRLRPHFADVL